MTTGDLNNNIRKMKLKLRQMKYTDDVDVTGLADGNPATYLPVYHYAFVSYSPALTASLDVELYGKTDARFLEGMYKVLRDVFGYKPPITRDQFFQRGFSERKVIMCCNILQLIKDKAVSLQPPVKKKISVTSKFAQRPKSATEIRTAEKQSPRVVNELTTAPAASPVRHVATHSSSVAVRHIASHTSHVSQTAPQQRAQSAAVAMETMPRVAHRGQGDVIPAERLTELSVPDYARVPQATLETPSISRVCRDSVEIVNIPRTREQDISEDSIVEINAQTSDSILQTPVHSRMEPKTVETIQELSHLHQTVELLTNQLVKMEDIVSQTCVQGFDVFTRQLDNLTARMTLVENRMSILETKVDQAVSPRQQVVNEVRSGAIKKKTSKVTIRQQSVQDSSLLSQPNTPSEGSFVCNSRIHSLLMNESREGTSVCSPIRQPPGTAEWTPGQMMSGEEDTFAMETEEVVKRSSTPTNGNGTIDQSMSFKFADEGTQDRVSRIKNMMKETKGLLKTASSDDSHQSKD